MTRESLVFQKNCLDVQKSCVKVAGRTAALMLLWVSLFSIARFATDVCENRATASSWTSPTTPIRKFYKIKQMPNIYTWLKNLLKCTVLSTLPKYTQSFYIVERYSISEPWRNIPHLSTLPRYSLSHIITKVYATLKHYRKLHYLILLSKLTPLYENAERCPILLHRCSIL